MGTETSLPTLEGRCGSCARFVRVRESVDQNGEVKRAGDCLLGVWPSPLYETNTCAQYIKRGTVADHRPVARRAARPRAARTTHTTTHQELDLPLVLPEEILDMDADEFREVLRDVIREELGVTEVELGGRWQGGEVVMKPGKEGTQAKSFPIEALFRKIVAVRDKLRMLEQKINGHGRLSEEDKVQMQQYITQAYGSLTTFNVLFADRSDAFVGQKGDKED